MNAYEAVEIARRLARRRGLAIGELERVEFVDDEYFDAVASQIPGPTPPGVRSDLVGNWFVSFECAIDPERWHPITFLVNPDTGRARRNLPL